MNRLLLLLLLLLAAVSLSLGQTFEFSAMRGASRMDQAPLGSTDLTTPDDEDTRFDRSATSTGFRLTLNTKGYYGHELGYTKTDVTVRSKIPYSDGSKVLSEGEAHIHQYSYNFLAYFMPRGERWRPYFTLGVHMHKHTDPKINGWNGHPTRNYGFNYGAGIKIRLFSHILARAEIRDCLTGKPYDLAYEQLSDEVGGITRQQVATFGFAIGF